MITPLDVVEKEFLVGVRGYVREEVRAFLRAVASELEQRDDRIRELESQVAGSPKSSRAESVGSDVSIILQVAEDVAAETRARAKVDAEETLARARATAEGLIASTTREAEAMLAYAYDALSALTDAGQFLESLRQDMDARLNLALSALQPHVELPGRDASGLQTAGDDAEQDRASQQVQGDIHILPA